MVRDVTGRSHHDSRNCTARLRRLRVGATLFHAFPAPHTPTVTHMPFNNATLTSVVPPSVRGQKTSATRELSAIAVLLGSDQGFAQSLPYMLRRRSHVHPHSLVQFGEHGVRVMIKPGVAIKTPVHYVAPSPIELVEPLGLQLCPVAHLPALVGRKSKCVRCGSWGSRLPSELPSAVASRPPSPMAAGYRLIPFASPFSAALPPYSRFTA